LFSSSSAREVQLMFVTRLRRLLGINATALLCWSFVLMFGAAPSASAQDTLAQAKVLYAAASYEEALAMLDKLSASTDQDATAIAEYRIFCLLALGRSEDANRTIEMVLRKNPFYVPSEAQVPPRIQTVIKSARQKLLPGIVLASYADAKAAFERKEPAAAVQFDRVLALLDDPDVKGVASLGDLRTVVVGFRDLAQALATPPPAPPPPAVTSPPPAPAVAAAPPGSPAAPSGTSSGNPVTPGAKPSGSAAPNSAAPTPNKATVAPAPVVTKVIYDATDAEVVGPVAVSQRLPNWAPIGADAKKTFNGVLHLIIDDRGNVTVADMRVPAHPSYDNELVNLARGWKFRPALRGGAPVAYMKLVSITLSPPK
jgi:hypothetical protein